MDNIGDILNEDYLLKSYIVDFAFYNKKYDCNGLKKYLTKRLNYNDENAYVMTGNGILTALVNLPKINTKNELHNKIVNYFNSVEEKTTKMYKLNVIYIEDLKYDSFKPFDYWLSTSIHLIEKRGKRWDYDFYMKHYNDDFTNRVNTEQYVDKFRMSKTHLDIQEYIQNRKKTKIEKEKHAEKMKIIKNELFVEKVKKHFRFTNDHNDYLSKKVVCELLYLDHKSKKDIRHINDMLIDYGVSYDRKKMINKEYGVFLGISLKS